VHRQCYAAATRGQYQNVILDQFLDNRDMLLVVLDPGIVTAHHSGDTPDATVDDIVI